MSAPKLLSIPSIASAGARAAIDAAVEEAVRMGKKMTIAVVDAGGELLALHRMDGAVLVSIDAAIIKAKTVVRTSVASGMLQEMLHAGNFSLMLLPGAVAMGGGLPIVHDGAIIGAIAASGDTVENDERASRAGIAAALL
jgi:uncharacterized protein GlcG (DUF336 family)